MKLGYVRVSSQEQREDRQLEQMKENGVEKIFCEKVSGKSREGRTELQKMIEFARPQDKIFISDFSRLSRNLRDLLAILDELSAKEVSVISLKENIDLSSAMGKLVLSIMGSLAEYEREEIHRRQAQGIKLAKERGVYTGGKRKEYDKAIFEGLYRQFCDKQLTKIEFAKKMGCSRPTLDRWIADRQTA